MKIALIGGSSTQFGGVEAYCRRFQDAFREYRPEIEVVPAPAETALGRLPSPAALGRMCASADRIREVVRALDPSTDIVWYQYANGADLIHLTRVRSFWNGGILCTLHVGEQWLHLRLPAVGRLAGCIFRRLDRVCVFSRAQKAILDAIGVERIVTIPTLLPGWAQQLGDNAISQPRSGVLFAGRLAREKGVFDLVEAMALAVRRGCPAHIDVLGSGEPEVRRKLDRQVQAAGLQQYVSFHGHQNEQQVSRFMLTRRLFVYPSYADAYPLSLLESRRAGMHPIAYALPGTDEIVERYGGSLVAKGDTHQLAGAICRSMAQAVEPGVPGALRSDLSWEKVVRDYAAIAEGQCGSIRTRN